MLLLIVLEILEHDCRILSLTQRSSGSLLELALSVSILDGVEECGHVFSEAPQAIGSTAFHRLQVPPVAFNGPLEYSLLPPEVKGRWVLYHV